uniref:Uncharacterized protein n=2 Tax=Clastoptera arizonana TaxID=38151 RepID=A0A1B6CYS6_9HEMI
MLSGRFPEMEYATELRQAQATKWAFRSVADGIEHFKAGRQTEAFQCLNKALQVDPANIEGLVARGALYANSGSFQKAIEDFENGLKVNPNHQNARKYLGETLVAYGRRFEEENKMDDALKAYEGCLAIIPFHEEAQNSVEYIKKKHLNGGMKLEPEGLMPALTPSKAQGVKDTLKQLLGNDEVIKEEISNPKKKKKEKKPRRKKHRSSSSSSSSSTGSSSSSSSSSSSDSSDSSHESPHKKKHKRKSETKDRSLSPLSKRMAIMDSSIEVEGSTNQRASHYNPPAVPFTFATSDQVNYPPIKTDNESDYEQRVRKFLEQTKGDSDYGEKVRKFLDETAKWKKEKKAIEEKAKKKRKKEKKAKSKSKKKKHEEKQKKKLLKELEDKKLRDALRREKHRRRSNNIEDEEEFLYGEKPDLSKFLSMGSLPDLEDLQNKLTAFYAKQVEKGPNLKKKEKSSSAEKSGASGKMKSVSPKLHYLLEEEKEEQARLRKLEKKKLDMFADSPPRLDNKLSPTTPVAPPVLPAKFKMQIPTSSNRLKKREKPETQKDTWDDEGEKRFIYVNEGHDEIPPIVNKEVVNEAKKASDKKKEAIVEGLAKMPAVMDKLGGFRINTIVAEKKGALSPSPVSKRKIRDRGSRSSSSHSDRNLKKRDKSPMMRHSRSRSHSRSRKKYSSASPPPPRKYSSDSRGSSYRKNRSRSKSGSYRSRSGRRYRSSESGSYRSRTYSRSRSRSNSMDYRRRSRSRSDDRHNYRNKYQGRYPRNRGTYYRPRFQNYKNLRGGNGNYGRGHRYIPRGGRGGYIPRMRRGRARYFNNYRPRERDYRRYDRDMSRSDDDMDSPMRKVDLAKERIDKILSEEKRHTGPLSEGEERDEEYIDRKEYEGKWTKDQSPDNKSDKKEDSKDRKYSKPNPW